MRETGVLPIFEALNFHADHRNINLYNYTMELALCQVICRLIKAMRRFYIRKISNFFAFPIDKEERI